MHTYNKYLFFFTLSLLLFNHIPSTSSSQCVDVPLFGNNIYTECSNVDEKSKKPFVGSSLVGDNSDRKIKLLFNCDEKNQPDLCKKANIAFNNAVTIIENTFDLKEQVIMNATFANLCKGFITCLAGQPQPLGAAGPARLIPYTDSDNVDRLYPQALLKQFKLAVHPEYSPVDIQAGFNSQSSTFWFRGDPPIGKDQVDFEYVLVHEMLHGLGFITSWDDYFSPDNPTILTPTPSFLENKPINYTGFQEYALDRFLVLTKDNSSLTLITSKINQFAAISSVFPDKKAVFSAFSKSPQFAEAKAMFARSTTRDTVAIRIDDENLTLETSLTPFKPGSTFSHLDFDTFSNTTDFLMRFKASRQVTIDDLTSVNGGDKTYKNPIGPKTIRIMQAMGYSVKENAGSFSIADNQNTNSKNTLTSPAAAQNSTSNTGNNQNKLQSQSNNAFTITINILSLISSLFIAAIFLL